MIFWIIVLVLAMTAGVLLHWRDERRIEAAAVNVEPPGWVYFLTTVDGGEADPPDPIKIGMTHRDPATNRLPEIETMSPSKLRLIAAIKAEVPSLLERAIHNELKPYRHHGEWYDRDATLAWLDHYREEYG